MSAANHIPIDELARYLADPRSADTQEISLHLAHCDTCRSQLNALSAMKGHLTAVTGEAYGQSMQTEPEIVEMLRSQAIERFVEGRLGENEQPGLRHTLSKNPLALKAALHYASHSTAMENALGPGTASASKKGPEPSTASAKSSSKVSLAAVKSWFTRHIPQWTMLPAAALATGILVVSLTLFQSPAGDRIQIASYQDNPVVEFRSASQAPGIGFFGTAAKSSAPFAPVLVTIPAEDTIELSWPPIPEAETYVVRLVRREKGGQTPLAQKTTPATTAAFNGLEILENHRYVWTLSGKTTDKKDFYAEGGFVFHHSD